MEQLGDKLVDSPICDSNACYESEFKTQEGTIKTWLCMTSGYTSNTTMTLDSDALKQTLEFTAELIKDLRQDHIPPGGGEKLAWFPTAITMPDKGMIFPEPIKTLTPVQADKSVYCIPPLSNTAKGVFEFAFPPINLLLIYLCLSDLYG